MAARASRPWTRSFAAIFPPRGRPALLPDPTITRAGGPLVVGLVACAAQKLPHPAPARELYTSQLFRKASAYAELMSDRWFVLSAKHGLVHPDTVLEPYDVRLSTGRASASNQVWAERVRGQLAAELDGAGEATLLVLAGEQYRTILQDIRWPHEVPLKGLGIGRQLGWLTARLKSSSLSTPEAG